MLTYCARKCLLDNWISDHIHAKTQWHKTIFSYMSFDYLTCLYTPFWKHGNFISLTWDSNFQLLLKEHLYFEMEIFFFVFLGHCLFMCLYVHKNAINKFAKKKKKLFKGPVVINDSYWWTINADPYTGCKAFSLQLVPEVWNPHRQN